MKFEFYVLNYNSNKEKVEMYNIFNNIRVQEYTERAVKKYLSSPKNFVYKPFGKNREEILGFEGLVREIQSAIAWQELGRREYEISVADAFTTDCSKLEKWDCYMQANANIRAITYEVLRQYKEQSRGKVNGFIKRY